jgi:hypothetical protein
MTSAGVPPPDWKDLYQLAVIELDPAKLPQRISDARDAILTRITENGTKPNSYHEHQELSDAINELRVLQEEYKRRVQQYGEPRQQKLG